MKLEHIEVVRIISGARRKSPRCNHNMYRRRVAERRRQSNSRTNAWQAGLCLLNCGVEVGRFSAPRGAAAVRRIVTAHAGALFLDMLPALVLRPDQHVPRDGLYYCI